MEDYKKGNRKNDQHLKKTQLKNRTGFLSVSYEEAKKNALRFFHKTLKKKTAIERTTSCWTKKIKILASVALLLGSSLGMFSAEMVLGS